MRKLTTVIAVVGAATAMAVALAAIPKVAQAGHLFCGDTLTANAIFDSDLDCSSLTNGGVGVFVDALTVGADNVTINLKGFSIIGPASIGPPTALSPPAVGGTCPAFFPSTTNRTLGIRVDGFDNINILNGVITGFEYGIIVKNAAGVGIKDIEADNNAFNALSVGDFDGVLPSANGGVPDLVLNRAYFHDNRNDAIGVSATSSLSILNSRIEDNCASGLFAAPRSSGEFPGGAALANVDIKHSSFVGNFRSAVNYWGASGSVEHSLIKGNNADTSFVIAHPRWSYAVLKMEFPSSVARMA